MTSVARLGESILDNKAYVGRSMPCATLGRPVCVCTIYDANIPGQEGRRAVTALGLFNDVIVRAALARGVDIIDLRSGCTDPGDDANEIEPGVRGGEKIARAIARAPGALEATSGIRVHALAH